ncbi:MAG: cyanophycinase [bacterium]|nr:cyanophycinase [bacterium]
MTRTLIVRWVIVAALAMAALSAQGVGRSVADEVCRPIAGALVLAGSSQVCDGGIDVFLNLAGGVTRPIVVLAAKAESGASDSWVADRLRARGAVAVEELRIGSADLQNGGDDTALLALLHARGVWLEDAATELLEDRIGRAMLAGVLARGGALGGAGAAAVALVRRPASGAPAFLPRSEFVATRDGRANRPDRAPVPGVVQWRVPPEAALAVHTGRRVCAYGPGVARVRVAANAGWAARAAEISPYSTFDPQERPGYAVDFVAWCREARQRLGPVFPPAEPAPPRLQKGALVLHGGRGVDDSTFERFLAAAGGAAARIVCIPSAGSAEPGQQPSSYSYRRLRSLGCKTVTVLHASDPEAIERDERQLATLRAATGVWIDGGRTYRVMDSYEHTSVPGLLADVLDRGGIVGGSSAGCQVLGQLLVRGNPRTNRELMHPAYTRALGLLPGVVLDAHFLQRDRGPEFEKLVARYPQFLGIGVDEKTALWVEGDTGTVIGANAVTFYVPGKPGVTLTAGARYALVERTVR